MNKENLNIVYVIQAYNRPHLLAPSLLSLRDQIINGNRKIILFNDGPLNEEDVVAANLNKMIFETFFDGYANIEYHISPINNGAEVMFVNTFFKMFEENTSIDCFALLEDDLYYEKTYIHNVETLLAQTYEDESIGSVSGFTRQTIYESDESLEKNKRKIVGQHNLIGAIYKRCGWKILKDPFSDFLRLKKESTIPHNQIFNKLNEDYNIHMPHTAYDKIVDHIFAKHRLLRISTFNRYLYHMGLFGTSCVK